MPNVCFKAHGHTALHMAACLHSNPRQEEILRLLLSRGADPSIRNMENGLPAHLLQGGPEGEQVSYILHYNFFHLRYYIHYIFFHLHLTIYLGFIFPSLVNDLAYLF